MTERRRNRDVNRLKQNAERQRLIRKQRDAMKCCRTCGRPAVVSKRTGLLTKQCATHLAMDVARKEIYVLPLQSLEAKARGKFELELPLLEDP